MLLQNRILMDKADDNGSPSGYGTETPTPATTPETPKTQGDTSNGTKGDASGEGATNTPTATDDKSKQTTTTESKEDVTGYTAEGDKPKVEETSEFELVVEGLSDESVAEIKEFAKAAKLTKEQAEVFVEKVKAQEAAKAAAADNYKVEEAKVFQKWEAELKADPDFGGENFAHSVHNVNKLIREELPGFKNILTTSGKRLPPSIMKDLNNVARKLYGETELVQGDKTSAKDTWNPLDFYKQKQ